MKAIKKFGVILKEVSAMVFPINSAAVITAVVLYLSMAEGWGGGK